MAIEVLAGTVLSVLLPYLSKGAEEFVKEAGKATFQKVKAIFEEVRDKMAPDQPAAHALANYGQNPAAYEPVLSEALTRQLKQDPDYATRLSEQLRSLDRESMGAIVRIGKIVSSSTVVHGDSKNISINAGGNVHYKQ
jgi:hypothetical protein